MRWAKYLSLFLTRCMGDILGDQLLKHYDEVELDFEAERITSISMEDIKVHTMVARIDNGELKMQIQTFLNKPEKNKTKKWS